MEDKESTESGSPGGKSESESPPITSGGDTVGGAAPGGDTVSCGGGVALQAMNMSIERSVGVIDAPAITVGGILGVSGGSGSGGGGGKKRGRPRKYDSDGNLRVPLVGSPPGGVILPPAPSVGFTLSPNPASKYSSGSKKGRGRPTGSGNWQILASLGQKFQTISVLYAFVNKFLQLSYIHSCGSMTNLNSPPPPTPLNFLEKYASPLLPFFFLAPRGK